MAHWILKTEPSTYSFADLRKAGRAVWDGVANPVALRHLREMAVGDDVLIYHTGDEKAVGRAIAQGGEGGVPRPEAGRPEAGGGGPRGGEAARSRR